MPELLSFEKTKQSIRRYLTKTTEFLLWKWQVWYIVSANCKTQLSNGQEISNNDEEAETLIIHTLEKMQPINCNVIVHATDTDVFLLLLKQCKITLCHNLYISMLRGFVNITALMNKLDVKAVYVLLSYMELPAATLLVNLTEFPKNVSLRDFLKIMATMQKLKIRLLNFK